MQRNGKLLVSTAFGKEKNKWKVLDYQVNNGLVTRFDLLIQQRRVQKVSNKSISIYKTILFQWWTTEHKFEVYVNGKKLWSPSFKNPEQVWFIEMYAGDPWYTPVTGWITNFKVETSDYQFPIDHINNGVNILSLSYVETVNNFRFIGSSQSQVASNSTQLCFVCFFVPQLLHFSLC